LSFFFHPRLPPAPPLFPYTTLFRSIAGRAFERRFQLAEHVEVKAAKLENGLLHVDLEQIVPEEKKPRRIAINAPELKTIEGRARSEEHTSELQSLAYLVCRLLLEKK